MLSPTGFRERHVCGVDVVDSNNCFETCLLRLVPRKRIYHHRFVMNGDSAQERAKHEKFMRLALELAAEAFRRGEVPVGALIVHQDRIIGKAWNQVEMLKDPTAHAEMIAITQAAAALGDWRLENTVLYVTKEPCSMCAGAIVLARIPLVVWGVSDPLRGGAVSNTRIFEASGLNHHPAHLSGVLEEECRTILQDFFKKRREA